MSHPEEADFGRLVRTMVEAGVEFIVVGGAAAVLHGAPITIEDLDIVHRRTSENVERLMSLIAHLTSFLPLAG